MSDLTTAEGTLAYLVGTQYEATDVQFLAGGHSAFTYRATLKSSLPTGEISVILKHYEDYVVLDKSFLFEVERVVRVTLRTNARTTHSTVGLGV